MACGSDPAKKKPMALISANEAATEKAYRKLRIRLPCKSTPASVDMSLWIRRS
jgi:hypothetical protein